MEKNIKRMSIAAMAALAMVSCSNHDNFMSYEDFKAAEFEANFKKIFGEIDPNQDWNLFTTCNANVSVNLGLAEGYTVGIFNENPLFNTQASLLAKTTVKDGGVVNMSFTTGVAQEVVYIGVYDEKGHGVSQSVAIENGQVIANIGGNAGTRATEAEWPVYAKTMEDYLGDLNVADMKNYTALTNDALTDPRNGNHTLNDKQYDGDNVYHWIGDGDGHHYRIPAGETVTEPWSTGNAEGLDAIVVYVEGKAVLSSQNTLNGVTIVVAEGGEVELTDDADIYMSTTGRFVVAKGGKITGAEGASFSVNNAGACYNAGEIKFDGKLEVKGSSFYNNGTIDVDIFTGTAGGTVTNFGHIKARSNSEAGTAYNETYVNACHLEFTGNAGIGGLTMLNNSRLDVGGKLLIPGKVKMYTLSEICCQDMQVQQTSFEGPTGSGEFAVVKVTRDLYAGYAGDLTASGELYWDWARQNEGLYNNNEWQDLDNEWSTFGGIKRKMAKFSTEASAPFTIPAGECTGAGYNDKEEEEIIPIPQGPVYYTAAFEDLGSTDDFDFNDVVLEIAHNTTDNNANVTCVCAGGTLEVKVYYDNTYMFTIPAKDTPSAAKGNYGKYTGISFANVNDVKKFKIEVVSDNGASTFVESANVTGKAPQALVIPGQWAWPTERTSIINAYPAFKNWVVNSNENGWYNSYEEGKVVK